MLLATTLLCASIETAQAQDAPPAGDELSIEQARLADRFDRLEMVLGRLAELSTATDPRRARVLREAIAKSREQDLAERFETIVGLLEDERLSAATSRQTDLEQELASLLSLLLKANRDEELDSQHRRIKKYLQEVARLIRLEKGIHARTEGGDGTERLAKEQQQVADQTGELSDAIGETEGSDDQSAGENNQPADSKENRSDENESREPADKSSSDPSGNGPAQDGKPQQGSPSEGSPSSQSPGGQPSDSGQSPSSPSDGSADGQSSEKPPQQPTDRAAQRLKSAQQRMRQAQERLEQANRDEAAAEQREALKELELAKAELERVLRQLREEEMERTLTLLAARFRKMLDAQLKVYDGTVRLDRVPSAERDHDEEIEAARLSREESVIAREADRALLLLREEGSSIAFPETVSLMRDDMQQVARRLADLKVGELTQGLEQDIIEALEETIAALEQAIGDLDKKRTPPGKSPPAGQPTEPPLVEKLAELKMIRALQMRINRRTMRYGKLIEGEQAEAPELLEALAKLADRQQRVYQATSDLSRGRND
jgi:hypothetical protein